MIIGVPKEIKNRENRVAIVPGGVKMLVDAGHKVLVEKGAGLGAGIPDDKYLAAGANVLNHAAEVWNKADMIIKVKEPIASEFAYLRKGQILYTYLHLAAAQELGHELIKRGVNAIAYETIQLTNG
ncbi:MAG: alanine dehydrogenase, partial [Oligoflexus sp.]